MRNNLKCRLPTVVYILPLSLLVLILELFVSRHLKAAVLHIDQNFLVAF